MGEATEILNVEKKLRGKYGAGRVWKRGRVWWIQYYDNGRKTRESSQSNLKSVAEKMLLSRLGEAAAGLAPEPRASKIKYEEMRELLYADYREKERKSLERKDDGTERTYSVPPR